MTVMVQDDHVTVGAWAACALTRLSEERRAFLKTSLQKKKKEKKEKKTLEKNFVRKLIRQALKNWKSYMLLLKNKKRKMK